VAVLWTERLPRGGGYVVHAGPLAEPVPEGAADEAAAAAALNRAMEAVIRQKPSQYLWGYHRYKGPRPLEGAP
jgi:Kdo2-lipid IVA lauroyltransferase/acyltransferase